MELNFQSLNFEDSFAPIYREDAFSMKKFQIYDGGRSTFKTTRHLTRIVWESLLCDHALVSYAITKDAGQINDGIMSDFKKVIDRATYGQFVEGKHYTVNKTMHVITFKHNGSRITFHGSKNVSKLKGRSVANNREQFGFLLLDEFADYEKKHAEEIFDLLPPTFARDDYKGEMNHFIWGDCSELDLDKPVLDENGELVYGINERGVKAPIIHEGTHSTGMKFLIAFNPPKNKYHWVYEMLAPYKDRPDTLYKTVNYNDILDTLVDYGLESIIATAETDKKVNYQRYLHVWLGEATGTDGLFFNNFDPMKCRTNIVGNVNIRDWVIGVDIGYAESATTFVLIGLNERNEFIIPMFYRHCNNDNGDSYGSRKYAQELLEFVNRAKLKYKIPTKLKVYYDYAAKAFKNDVDLVMREQRYFPCKLYKADKNREVTLSILRTTINEGRLKYLTTEGYQYLEEELAKATTHPSKENDIVKDLDHFIDAVRYGLPRLTTREFKNAKRSII